MPKVGNKKFKKVSAAKRYAKKTGKRMVRTKKKY